MLDLECKGYLETKGNKVDRSKELMVLGLLEEGKRPSLESWGLFRRSYIHELPSHLSSKSRNVQQVLEMDE